MLGRTYERATILLSPLESRRRLQKYLILKEIATSSFHNTRKTKA